MQWISYICGNSFNGAIYWTWEKLQDGSDFFEVNDIRTLLVNGWKIYWYFDLSQKQQSSDELWSDRMQKIKKEYPDVVI